MALPISFTVTYTMTFFKIRKVLGEIITHKLRSFEVEISTIIVGFRLKKPIKSALLKDFKTIAGFLLILKQHVIISLDFPV